MNIRKKSALVGLTLNVYFQIVTLVVAVVTLYLRLMSSSPSLSYFQEMLLFNVSGGQAFFKLISIYKYGGGIFLSSLICVDIAVYITNVDYDVWGSWGCWKGISDGVTCCTDRRNI